MVCYLPNSAVRHEATVDRDRTTSLQVRRSHGVTAVRNQPIADGRSDIKQVMGDVFFTRQLP